MWYILVWPNHEMSLNYNKPFKRSHGRGCKTANLKLFKTFFLFTVLFSIILSILKWFCRGHSVSF